MLASGVCRKKRVTDRFPYPKSLQREPGKCECVFRWPHAAAAVVFVVGLLSFNCAAHFSSALAQSPRVTAPPLRADVTVASEERAGALFVCPAYRSARRRGAAGFQVAQRSGVFLYT